MRHDDELQRLEEAMWRPETRCDRQWMDAHLSPGFVEFGESGRRYNRRQILDLEFSAFSAVLPLRDLQLTELGDDHMLVAYRSEMNGIHANRSSIWRRTESSWVMEFHQGTPTTAEIA